MKIEYEYRRNNLIRPGSIVEAKKIISFSDKTCHWPKKPIEVTEKTISYYVVNLYDYNVIKY